MSTLLHGILFIWSVVFCYSSLPLFLHRNIGLFPPTKSENYAKTIRSLPQIFIQNRRLEPRTWWFYICLCKFNLYHHVVASGSSALFF